MKPRITLTMIVKDEAPVIETCLNSVKDIIDAYCIVDTGSSDNTMAVIDEYFKKHGISGQLHQRKWVNFAHNRNEALELTDAGGGYILTIDADDRLTYDAIDIFNDLDADCYTIMWRQGKTQYRNRFLFKPSANRFYWTGVVHEVLVGEADFSEELIEGAAIVCGADGNRAKDPQRWIKDALMLELDLQKDPGNSRSRFYLGQSYDAAELKDLAYHNYKLRSEMKDGYCPEAFISLLRMALILDDKNESEEKIVAAYLKAYEFAPWRIEPIFHLARYYTDVKKEFNTAHIFMSMCANAPSIKDDLFVDADIYDWRRFDDMGWICFELERYKESKRHTQKALELKAYPQERLAVLEDRLLRCKAKLSEKLSIRKNDVQFKVASWQEWFADLQQEENWEPFTFNVLDHYSDKHKTYVDVGAWVGPTVLYAANKFKKVVCFEADPVALQALEKNLAVNQYDNVTLIKKALADKNGTIKFGGNWVMGNSESTILVNDPQFFENGHRPDQRGTKESRATNIIEVESIDIESAIEKYNIDPADIALIKMDIEGGEHVVIPAMENFLKTYKPALYVSLHYCYLAKKQSDAVIDLLFDIYGKCHTLFEKDEKKEITKERIKNEQIESVLFE